MGSFLQSLGQEDRSLINHTLSAARELEQRYCTPSYATGGGKVPTNCEVSHWVQTPMLRSCVV